MIDFTQLDFSGLLADDIVAVKAAITSGENFHGYIPSDGLDFILRNHRPLAAWGALEAAWLDAYVHASNFNGHGLWAIKAVFDACDRERLLQLKPLNPGQGRRDRYSLFRGCAGPIHTLGLSWTTSLDKAIWYAAKHAAYHHLTACAVYATTVAAEEIYCRLDHYDDDIIVYPSTAWKIEVPESEFRLNRVR